MARNGYKVTVWGAVSVNKVFGPYHFDIPVGSGASYKHLLTSYLLPMKLRLASETIFQWVVAPPYHSLEVCQLLDENYSNLWIGRGRPAFWPPR